MPGHYYLCLRMTRLRRGDEWANDSSGLCFVFPRTGAGTYICGSVVHPVLPGDVLVLGAANSGSLLSRSGNVEFEFSSFSSHIEHMLPLFAAEEICLLQEVVNRLVSSKRYLASSALAATCNKLIDQVPPQFNLDHRSQLLNIVATVLSAEIKCLGISRPGFGRRDEQVTATLETMSATDISMMRVSDLARRFHCSERHLNRLFHAHFGISVAEIRMNLRLLRAMVMLRNQDAKIIEIAQQCGFKHSGLFNACFKRQFGSSPTKWRQQPKPLVTPIIEREGGQDGCRMRKLGLCPWSNELKGASAAEAAPSPSSSAPRRSGSQKPSEPSRAERNGRQSTRPFVAIRDPVAPRSFTPERPTSLQSYHGLRPE